MYKEVSFDPSCMGSMEYYGLVRQHFGYDHGRYISAEVKAWAREAMQSVKRSDLPPVRQKSIKNYLNRLVTHRKHDEFHVTADRQGFEQDKWIAWHNAQIAVRPFSFAVSESKEIDCIGIDDINDGCDAWCLNRSISVDRNTKDIVEAFMPLIEISNTVTIIDPYFRLEGNNALVELMVRCGQSGVACVRVASSMTTPNAKQIYNREYKSLNAQGVSFCWIKVPDKIFHDRYFITDVGAIRSGQGFMEDTIKGIHADKANLNIIGRDEAERTLNDLNELLKSTKAVEILSI
jgi:hypothetical protein